MSTIDVAIAGNNILLVDDDDNTLNALRRVLETERYTVSVSNTGRDAIEQVKAALPYIILLDLGLPDADGVDLLREFLLQGVKQVIIISGTDSVETTRLCLREGAFDFLLKPVGRNELVQAVRRASSAYDLVRVTSQCYPLELQPGFGALETPSEPSQRLFKQLRQFDSHASANALISGSAGLFKRDIAALVHHYNKRSGPALLINCALEIDDEALFRFTNTEVNTNKTSQIGYIEQASGGSLVLDDVSLLPLSIQRWLAEYVNRFGNSNDATHEASRRLPCNIIGILKENVELALEEGRLSSELHAALSVNHISVPSLNERAEDVAVYAQHAIAQLNTILECEKSLSPEFLKFLTTQPWEGNLIELKNRLLVAYRSTEDGDEIIHDPKLWTPVNHVDSTISPQICDVACAIGMSLRKAENLLIKATLDSVGNNKSKAAKILGISVKTLYNRQNN